MENVNIQQLIQTTQDLIKNLTVRIDSILNEYKLSGSKEVFSADRIIFMIEDLNILADAAAIIEREHSSICLEELTEKLRLLHDSMTAKDEMMFNDIMEFELKPLLEHWEESIEFTVKH